ncbi:hypothetical protein, partial [Luteococcus sp.]|uniref:hypothetical protein n=1 Tax=Luteococcus sp. TaxID=1969402 RepID=UPI003736C06E
MTTIDNTIRSIVEAETWDQRVAQIRLVAQRHGTADHQSIYARVAREVYVPHLAPDFAYINQADFYDLSTFQAAYATAAEAT